MKIARDEGVDSGLACGLVLGSGCDTREEINALNEEEFVLDRVGNSWHFS